MYGGLWRRVITLTVGAQPSLAALRGINFEEPGAPDRQRDRSMLMYVVDALAAMQIIIMVGYFCYRITAPPSQVRPGWAHVLFKTGFEYGLAGPILATCFLMGLDDYIHRGPAQPWWWVGAAFAACSIAFGSNDVAWEIDDVRKGVKIRPASTAWRLPQAIWIMVPTAAAFVIGLKFGQSILAAERDAGRFLRNDPDAAILVASVVNLAVMATWALCLGLLTGGRQQSGVPPLDIFDGSTRATVGNLVAVLKGVLWCGFALLLAYKVWPPESVLGWAAIVGAIVAFGKGLSDAGATVSRLVALAKGLLLCGWGLSLAYALWPPETASGWAFLASAVVAFAIGLSEIGPALRSEPVSERPPIAATEAPIATDGEARRAARGDDRDSPVGRPRS